jgi:hypothetical protein
MDFDVRLRVAGWLSSDETNTQGERALAVGAQIGEL